MKLAENILVTGASGFVGSQLCSALEAAGHIVTGVSYPDCDLSTDDGAESFLDSHPDYRCDAIIHLAGKVPKFRQSVEEQDADFNTNLRITFNVVKLALALKPERLINFSSVAVYPHRDGVFDEESATRPSVNPNGMYGLAKVCAENILDFHLSPQIRCVHLRIGQLYGGPLTGGEQLYQLMMSELTRENVIRVFGDGKREGNFVSVERLCRYVLSFLTADVSGVFNIGDEHMSYLAFAEKLVAEHGDRDSKIVLSPRGVKTVFRLDVSKVDDLMRGISASNQQGS